MKILLVQPDASTIRGLVQPPLALMYIACSAMEKGHTVQIVDRNIETNTPAILRAFQPDIVGITALTGRMILDGVAVSKYVKQNFPETKVVWGGIHTSILPENTLENQYVDYVVVGEGEQSFPELVEYIESGQEPKGLPGIGYKRDGEIIVNERRAFLKELDSLPLLPWDLIDCRRYLKHETLLITSRGCPHRCAFCYNEKYNFKTWRCMSPERVKEEIIHAQKSHPIRRFRFDDDNFTVNKNRFYEILSFLPKNIPLYFESRVDYIDENFCRIVSEFKDAFVFLGVESGDQDILTKIKKDIRVEQIFSAFSLMNRYKIKTSASFMIGIPGETQEQMNKTLRMIDKLKATRSSCCIYVPHPGAPLTDSLFESKILDSVKTLEDWGKHADAENAKCNRYSEIPISVLTSVYKKYWWKSIRSFIFSLRFNWLFAGLLNMLKIRIRKMLRSWYMDIQ